MLNQTIMNRILMIFTLCISVTGCSVEKTIFITKYRKSEELKMTVNPAMKRGGLGLLIIKPIGLYLEIPDLIKRLKVLDSNDNLIYELEYVNLEFGGHTIIYGQHNKKEYNQVYPINTPPKPLTENNLYFVVLTTESGIFKRKFVFNEAEIRITNRDKIEE
jgi:hypothetical protein